LYTSAVTGETGAWLAGLRARQQLAGRDSEGLAELPEGSERDRPPCLDPLEVPKAEATIHHVLLGQAALQAKALNPTTKVPAEAIEVPLGHATTVLS